jgi:zinc transport system ATP-binding protein
MKSKEPVIQVDSLTISYGSSQVVRDISFGIDAGDYVALVGENGSGKSTIIKAILGLIKPNQGSVYLFGTNLHRFKDWYKLGYLPQNINKQLNSIPITVEESLVSAYVKKSGSDIATRLANAYEVTDTSQLAHKQLSDLSGGQLQRVMIARSLMNNPEILILDEPTNNLDNDSTIRTYDFLRDLNKNHGITIVLITHDSEHLTDVFDRVLCVGKSTLCGKQTTFEHIHNHTNITASI